MYGIRQCANTYLYMPILRGIYEIWKHNIRTAGSIKVQWFKNIDYFYMILNATSE